MSREKPIAPEEVSYSGRMFQIVHQQMSDGKTVKTFEIARRAPGTRIIFARGRDFLLTREFRYELDRYDYRLPGGKVFDRLSDYQAALAEGVDIVDAAREAAMREAREEVGLEPIELQPWAVSACGATVKWDLYFFVCRAFNQLGGVHHESGEDLSHDWYSFDEVRAMCLDGRIDEERSAIQLLKVMAKEILV